MATVPAWAAFVCFGSEFEKANRVWRYEASLPPYLIGVGLPVVLTTLAALALLLIDHILWRRRQNERTNKTN